MFRLLNEFRADQHAGQGRWLAVIVLCTLLNALDGYDVLVMSVAAPKLAAEWQIAPAMLGLLLSLEIGGIAVGSIIVGQLGDRFGRRPLLMLSVAIVTIGMLFSAMANGVTGFAISRLAAGVGLGGIITLTPTIAAEFAPPKYRTLGVSIVVGGYAVGSFLGAALAVLLIAEDWRLVFMVGAAATGLLLPVLMLVVRETPEFAASAQTHSPRSIADTTNGQLSPTRTIEVKPKGAFGIAELFRAARAPLTLLLLAAYLAHVSNIYFFMKWTPTLMVNLGFEPATAASLLVWANGGSVLGSILTTFIVRHVQPLHAIQATLVAAGLGVACFGAAPADLQILSSIALMAGLAMSMSASLFYVILVQSYPVHLRAGATGFVLGMGRAGAWISPIAAGLLFSLGAGRGGVSALFGFGSMLAAVAILLIVLRHRRGRNPAAPVVGDNVPGSTTTDEDGGLV